MEGIIFIGIQGSGKSTYYKNNFFNTHLRISLDMLNTRNKEDEYLKKSIELHQKVVIDNTNPTEQERRKYLDLFRAKKYKTIGYYFQSKLEDCIKRNNLRENKERIPKIGILGTYNKLELPTQCEGFDELYYVEIIDDTFKTSQFKNEI